MASLDAPATALLARTPLFAGIAEHEIATMLACLDVRRLAAGKGELVMRTGSRAGRMGIVLSGAVGIEQTDARGIRSILGRAEAGETFAEAYACSPSGIMGADVVAVVDSDLLLLDIDRAMRTCTSACGFHTQLVRNLLAVMAERNLRLTRKIAAVAPRTIRERVLAYLGGEAAKGTGPGRRIAIPYSRQQLADYLCVDRSALCHELSKMRAEGLIGFERNEFWLA